MGAHSRVLLMFCRLSSSLYSFLHACRFEARSCVTGTHLCSVTFPDAKCIHVKMLRAEFRKRFVDDGKITPGQRMELVASFTGGVLPDVVGWLWGDGLVSSVKPSRRVTRKSTPSHVTLRKYFMYPEE